MPQSRFVSSQYAGASSRRRRYTSDGSPAYSSPSSRFTSGGTGVTLASAAVGAGWIPPERIDTTLRVMTWNLWWRFGPCQARQEGIFETLARVHADVVCLQEVWETREGESQAGML